MGSRARSGDVVVRESARAGVASSSDDGVSVVVELTLGTMGFSVDGFRLDRRDLSAKATRADARATMGSLGGIARRARGT